jgi:rhodanese-related sulfurtransferase
MLRRLALTVLSLILITTSVLAVACTLQDKAVTTVTDVSPAEAYALVVSRTGDPDFVILDIRTPAEFAGGHIQNAVNIDFYSEGFRDELNNLDKKKVYLIYCRTGNRSTKAIEMMKDLDFETVYHMVNGITAWVAEGLTTVK